MGFRRSACCDRLGFARLDHQPYPGRGARRGDFRRGRAARRAAASAARAQGTTVAVSDLYFNTPARRKFLRTDATEFGHCDEVFRRIALAQPRIAFQLKHNGRVSHVLRAQPIAERAAALLGDAFFSNSLAVEAPSGALHLFGRAGTSQAEGGQYFS